MSHMITPVELNDLELDAVSGGTHGLVGQGGAGLVVAQVAVGRISVADGAEILNDANIGVQAAVLSIGRQRQQQS